MAPTSLPGDNYDLMSDMIQSLATRTDISYRVWELTEIKRTVDNLHYRATWKHRPTAPEPFSMNSRISNLSAHWNAIAVDDNMPDVWDDESDTTFLKPILTSQPLDGTDAEKIASRSAGGHKLTLTTEESDYADAVYYKWRKDYDHKQSWYKDHPPKPIGWVPRPKTSQGRKAAWESLYDDGIIKMAKGISQSRLVSNKAWKPIYGYDFGIDLPFGWLAPGETEESRREDVKASSAYMKKELERKKIRTEKQDEYLEQLRKEMVARQKKEKEEKARAAALGAGKEEL